MKTITRITLALLLIGMVWSCKDNANPESEPNIKTFRGTQSPGDVWEWELNVDEQTMVAHWDYGTFDDLSDDITIYGNYVTLPSGFLKVTISHAEPESAEVPEDGTAFFYALEISDMAMIVKPEGSIKGDMIAMVGQGDCDALEESYNYILTAPGEADFDPITEEAYGHVAIDANGNITGTGKSLDCIQDECTVNGSIGGLPTLDCVGNGAIEIMSNGATEAQGQFTNAGVMMLDFGYGNGGVFALKRDHTLTLLDMMDKQYNGVAYLPTHKDKTIPVHLSFYENEKGIRLGVGNAYLSIEDNTIEEEAGVIVYPQNIEGGLITGVLKHNSGGTTPFAAALTTNGEQQILVLTSKTDEQGNNPFILVLVRQ